MTCKAAFVLCVSLLISCVLGSSASAQSNFPAASAGNLAALREAALRGNPDAQWKLGRAYRDSQNLPVAIYWFRQAAARGYSFAEVDLGNIALKARSYSEALSWFTKAVAQGNQAAMADLAVMYENGLGVPRNSATAQYWYAKAGVSSDHAPRNNTAMQASAGDQSSVTQNGVSGAGSGNAAARPCPFVGYGRVAGPAQGCVHGVQVAQGQFASLDNGSWKVTQQAHYAQRPAGMPAPQQDPSWCARNTVTASALNECSLEQHQERIPSQQELTATGPSSIPRPTSSSSSSSSSSYGYPPNYAACARNPVPGCVP